MKLEFGNWIEWRSGEARALYIQGFSGWERRFSTTWARINHYLQNWPSQIWIWIWVWGKPGFFIISFYFNSFKLGRNLIGLSPIWPGNEQWNHIIVFVFLFFFPSLRNHIMVLFRINKCFDDEMEMNLPMWDKINQNRYKLKIQILLKKRFNHYA